MITMPAMHWSAPASAGGTLRNSLLAHWTLDETNGSRADDLGAYNLADHNLVGSAAGLLGNAASFDDATGQRLASTPAAFPDLSAGLAVHGWIYPSGDGMLFALDAVSGTNRLLQVMYHPASGGYLDCFLFGSGTFIQWNVGGGGVPASTWSRISVWWDPADGKGRIRINNNSDVVSSGSLVALNAGAVVPVEIGDLGGSSQPYGGLADEFAMWNRVLTSQELTTLYNGGAPLPFSSY